MNILELKKDIFIQRNNNKANGWLFNVTVAFRDEENEERKKKEKECQSEILYHVKLSYKCESNRKTY